MFSIVKETGWSEDFVLDMPMSKIWGYRHAIMNSYDAETHYITTQDEKDELMNMLDLI